VNTINRNMHAEVKLPNFGMGIHEQYTMYGHFVLLAKLLKTAPKVRLFMDQDSGFVQRPLVHLAQ
jgi:hypothetical protein